MPRAVPMVKRPRSLAGLRGKQGEFHIFAFSSVLDVPRHGFPLGVTWFSPGLSTDVHKQKMAYLKSLMNNASVRIVAAYGSGLLSFKNIYKHCALSSLMVARELPLFHACGVDEKNVFDCTHHKGAKASIGMQATVPCGSD